MDSNATSQLLKDLEKSYQNAFDQDFTCGATAGLHFLAPVLQLKYPALVQKGNPSPRALRQVYGFLYNPHPVALSFRYLFDSCDFVDAFV